MASVAVALAPKAQMSRASPKTALSSRMMATPKPPPWPSMTATTGRRAGPPELLAGSAEALLKVCGTFAFYKLSESDLVMALIYNILISGYKANFLARLL
jgi:hypothetical protein